MPFVTERFSVQLAREIRSLVESHKRLQDEPLLLAVCYDPGRNSGDVFIFEVMDNFGGNMVDPDGDLFEVEFGASTTVDMRLPAGNKLHLVLTNPTELSVALRAGWKRAREVVTAISNGGFEILFEDAQRGHALVKQMLPTEAAE